MFEVLAKIIPLDLASTLSPGILAVTVLLLGSKKNPKLKVLYFFLGSLLVAIAIGLLGFFVSKSVSSGFKPTLVSSILDLTLGVAFVIWAFKILLEDEKKIKKRNGETSLFTLFLAGFLVSITNFDAVLLSLAAAREVGGASLKSIYSVILIAVNTIFFTLPITFPVLLETIAPRTAETVLSKINSFLMKYARLIVFILFIAFGVYFTAKGLHFWY